MSPFKSIKGRALGKLLEGYKSSDIGKGFGAGGEEGGNTMTGGTTVTSPNGIIYHVFTEPGTLTIATGNQPVYYTLVGGGGGGAGYGPAYFGGVAGQDTTAFGFTAVGGGAGGPYPGGAGGNGGSGGGGGTGASGGNGQGYPGPGQTQQGHPGGSGAGTYEGGGGGGAGQPGENAVSGSNGDGGNGKVLFDDAPTVYREGVPNAYGTPGPYPGRWVAGGGGGGSGSSPARGVGGAGGGADGGKAAPDPVRGVVNTGGGGGGYENGGGGGGAGGGGAGGYISGELTGVAPGQSFPITIGSGGSPAPGPADNGGGPGIVIVTSSNQVSQ